MISLVLVIAISLHTVEGKTYLSYYVTIVWGDSLSEAAFFFLFMSLLFHQF